MTEDLPDGIHFNLPMETYVAQPRLGAHALGKLLISAATFWADCPWLNPKPRIVSDSVVATRMIGSAYHTARLEPEHFMERYVRQIDKADFAEEDGFLSNGTEIGEALALLGEAKKKGGETVMEQARRLDATGYDGIIWPLHEAVWLAGIGDRQPLSATVWEEIITDGERLRSQPQIADLISDGYAEVSILWTDAKGFRRKARPDYLKADSWSDVKTFSNQSGKHLEQAIIDAFRFYRYHVGAAHYRDAIEAVRNPATELRVHGSEEHFKFIEAIRAQEAELACWYIFQEKSGVPNILAKEIEFFEVPLTTKINNAGATREGIAKVEAATRQPALWFSRAQREIRKALRTYKIYSEVYEPGQPWLPFNPLGKINDLSFSAFWLDEEVE